MTRNQKIALGCGGLGCLGLIVVIIASVLLYMFTGRLASTNSNRIFNSNSNRSINRNSSSAPDTNSSESNSSDTSSSSSMSDEEKHRLFQAAGMTGDTALVQRVLKKLGLTNANGTPTAGYEKFVEDHALWAIKNFQFIQSVNTPEKARAYVEEHMTE